MFLNALLNFPSHRLLHMPVDRNTSKQKRKPQVNHGMALKRGEIEEIESDDKEEDEQEEDIEIGEFRSLYEKVECLSLKYGDSKTCLDLSRSLRQF